MSGNGVLALWKDCAVGEEPTFERWYQTEHMTERLSIPGFFRCRRYEALKARSMFFTWYEVDVPEVLHSPAYLKRLGDPSPLTSTIMESVVKNMSRTVCHRDVLFNNGFGTMAVTVKISDLHNVNSLRRLSSDVADPIVLARSELWTNAESGTNQVTSKEEALRGGDAKIHTCLMLEYLRRDPAEAAADRMQEKFPSAEIGVYQLLCEQR